VIFWHPVDRRGPILDELRSSQRECPFLSVTRDVDGRVSRRAAAHQLDLPPAGLGIDAQNDTRVFDLSDDRLNLVCLDHEQAEKGDETYPAHVS
jgi:hypothetical protein